MPDPSGSPAPNTAPPTAPTAAERLSGPALWIALAVLVAWGIFIVFLVGETSEDEVHWTRLAWLFSSAEAVVFAAAGALFGSTVQRQRAENAEKRAETSERDAANGRALAQALVADDGEHGAGEEAAAATTGMRGAPSLDAPVGRGAGGDVARRHARLARSLFPAPR